MNVKAVFTTLTTIVLVCVTGRRALRYRDAYVDRRQRLARIAKYKDAERQLAEASEDAVLRAEVEWDFGIGLLAHQYFIEHPLPLPQSASIQLQLNLIRHVFFTYYKEVATRDLLMEALRIKHEQSATELDGIMVHFNDMFDGKLERLRETLESIFTEEQLRTALPAGA